MLNYDLFADQYNMILKHGFQRKVHQFIIEQLKVETDLSQRLICELGCGQGSLAADLSGLGAKVIAIDSSEKQLEYARSLTDQVDWIQGDALALPDTMKSETFDIVISSLMLMDVPDHEAVFNESYRILKPGGIMIWMIMHPCFQSPFSYPMEDASRMCRIILRSFGSRKGIIRSVLYLDRTTVQFHSI